MKDSLVDYMNNQRKNVLEKCTQCGICIKKCPIIKNTELKDAIPNNVQKEIIKFLNGGNPNDTVYTRAFSCMECFACVDNCCPQGLNPMLINELIKWDYRSKHYLESKYNDPKAKNALQRIIASIQIPKKEYAKIFTSSPHRQAEYVFFPGCNVYFQPDKLLSALDIMDIINKDWAFVPGLDYCCGETHIGAGAIEEADHISTELFQKLSSYNPKTVIFWCPTCLCRFEKTIAPTRDIPFETISFPQFVAQNVESLTFKKELNKSVTLHEACKSAFTGLDLDGVRNILKCLPGISLTEMPRHRENTSCCGSGAISFFPESFDIIRNERMEEAAKTSADLLVNVCHFCHESFLTKEHEYSYSVVNFVTLLAEALGIVREDNFKKFKKMDDAHKILAIAQDYVEESPFSRNEIIEAVDVIFDK